MMTETAETETRGFNIALRPHHITGYLLHETTPHVFYLPDEDFMTVFRNAGYDYPPKVILHWRNIMRDLHEKPDLRIKYTSGLDDVCAKCNFAENCGNDNHWSSKEVNYLDYLVVLRHPELELGMVYTANDLRKTAYFRGLSKKKKL